MRNYVSALLVLIIAVPFGEITAKTPEEDLQNFRAHFELRFPEVSFNEYANGVYAINEDARSSWEAIEDFPPYIHELELGEQLFNTPFANGKRYSDCLENGGKNIRQFYPKYDAEKKAIITIEGEINRCRKENGEDPLPWKKGAIAAISAYIASSSNGEKISITVPDDNNALEFYRRGKQHFYAKRGQLNLSCANCHIDNSGNRIRGDTLSPALGHPTHFPVYRLKWRNLGTMHRRFAGCNEQVRAKAFPAQSDEYKSLEYFLNYMSNDQIIQAPSSRK